MLILQKNISFRVDELEPKFIQSKYEALDEQ